MNIIIDEWVKAIRQKLEYKFKSRKTLKRFTDKKIREIIYDYLDKNIYTDFIDNKQKIKVFSGYDGNSAVLNIIYSDGDVIICEEDEDIRNHLTYNTLFHLLVDDRTDEVKEIEINTQLGYKTHPWDPDVPAPNRTLLTV